MVPYSSVVANPPYQRDMEGTSDSPIYPHFMDMGYSCAKVASFVTPARFMFDAGKTPKAWNRRMLADPCLSVSFYDPSSRQVFAGAEIMGGIAVTTRDANRRGEPISGFSPFVELNGIRAKVWSVSESSLQSILFQQSKFDLDRLYEQYPECRGIIGSGGRERRLTTSIFEHVPAFSESADNLHDVAVLGLVGNRRVWRHIWHGFLMGTRTNLDGYKVMVPASNGSKPINDGAPTALIGVPVVGGPSTGHTQSFISFGCFGTEEEARACERYVRTRFARAMLGILKVTQHNHGNVWRFVPMQDFTDSSEIDWSCDGDDLDDQLFDMYMLSDEERDFVRNHVSALAEGGM